MRKNYTKTYHIIFDAFGIKRTLLDDEEFAFKLLLEIPKMIGMRVLSGPNVIRDYDKVHPGITGFAIIDFSHISIHTFVNTREAFIDIFSCRPFDYDKTRNYLYKKLQVKPSQVETLEVKYPWE